MDKFDIPASEGPGNKWSWPPVRCGIEPLDYTFAIQNIEMNGDSY